MDIVQGIQLMNEGKAKRKDIAERLGVHPSTLSRMIKEAGFEYDNVNKLYINIAIAGSATGGEPKGVAVRKDSDKKKNEGQPKAQPEARQQLKAKIELTEHEIIKLKNLIAEQERDVLYLKLKEIPNEETKKKSVLITDTTYKEFEQFAEQVPHITKNQLIEIALRELMQRYGG